MEIPLKRAVGWLLLSLVLVSGSATLGWYYYHSVKSRRVSDPKYNLFAIVQTGPEREVLSTSFLAETLGLSVNRPTNLYAFNCREARGKLLASPVIKEAWVKTFLPGIVYVDYVARKPLVYVSDYSNTAMDVDGVLIPCSPFFTPKRLPQLYLGLPKSNKVWGMRVQGRQVELARNIKTAVSWPGAELKRIDVSRASAESLGQRQAIVTIEESFEIEKDGLLTRYAQEVALRLPVTHYAQALANYQVLRQRLVTQAKETAEKGGTLKNLIVDMRLPELAYVQKEGEKA